MPYRAPELFDVKTGKMLDEKVDIWVSCPVRQADGSLLAALSSPSRMDTLLSRLTVLQLRWRWEVDVIVILRASRLNLPR